MRHVLGLLFGLLLAPVTWFLVSLGHFRFLDALQRFGDDQDKLPTELAFGAILIVAAGAWLGVLLSSRLSPLAPAICGLAWLGLGAAFVTNVERVSNFLPSGPTGQQGIFVLPLEHGYAFLIGTALLAPLFSPARWRRPAAKPVAAECSARRAGRRAGRGARAAARHGPHRDRRVPGDLRRPRAVRAAQPVRPARPLRISPRRPGPGPGGGRGGRGPDTGYRGATPLSDAPSYRGGYREQPTGQRGQVPPTGAQRRQEPAPWTGERIYEETREQARHRSPDR